MTINKLTDEQKQKDEFSTLREAATRYQTALAWYQSNVHCEAAMRAWDAATSEFMQIIGSRETDIIAALLVKLSAQDAELQEYRKAQTADRETLKRLAVILSGSDAPGEMAALTVTALSFVNRCKQLSKELDILRGAAGIGYESSNR